MPWVSTYGFLDSTGASGKMGEWFGTGTTDALGAWAVDYTEAGFTAAPFVKVNTILNTATDYDNVWDGGTRTCTSTAAAGICLRGANLLVLGPTVRQAPAGLTFMALAVGPIG